MTYASYLAEKLDIPEIAGLNDMGFSKVNSHLFSAKTEIIPSDNVKNRMADFSAEYLGLKRAKTPKETIDQDLLEPVTLFMAKTALFLPLGYNKAGEILVAISSPEKSLPLVDDYERLMGKEVVIQYMPEDELLDLIHKTWGDASMAASDVADEVESESDLQSMTDSMNQTEDLLDSGDDAPIIRLINSVLTQAMRENASDIHIEPFEKQVKVRFRVDGVMHTVITPNAKLHAAMSARLKVMAGLDIAEKRLPQDGRFKIRLAGHETDIRISTLPTQHGERIVLRLLGQTEGVRAMKDIGLRPAQVKQMEEFFNLANGMIFVCGPTGSGKTSTLYAGLQEINTPDKNIVTVEDPVEYEMEGLGQIPVNAKIGMTFAAGLRSILRQDPDVVVVGETRDLETAEIAIESSLTGHLVISTIHTNDAPSSITRLIEMGIEPFLVASSMRAVVAQRMIRLLNPVTKKPRKLDAETEKMIKDNLPAEMLPKKIQLFEASSTTENPSGYKGRTGIFEILAVTESVRAMINAKANDAEIREAAQKEGMLTLFQEGLLRVANGETTLEEVLRVTKTQG